MNVQYSLIQEIMLYEFELDHNATTKAAKNCCEKSDGAVNHRTLMVQEILLWLEEP